MRFQTGNDQLCDPIEESRQVQMRHHQHHREEQHNRAEMDEVQGIVYPYRARHEHQYRPDDRCARTINLHSGKFSQGEYDVTCNENRIRAQNGEIGHRGSKR